MPEAQSPKPIFREMSRRESERLLESNNIGRLAFSFHDKVDIRPVHYVYSSGWVYGRTSPGEKLVTLQHNQWVAFEVDEVAGPFEWASVIAKGTFYSLSDSGGKHDVELYERALTHLRTLMPEALKADDPVAFRTEVFGISVDSLTGRACSTH